MNAQGPQWQDDELHAYVDGELDAARRAQLEADAAGDAVLAARVARQQRLRAALRARFDAVLDEPIPQRLQQAMSGTGGDSLVTPIGAARKPRARPTPLWWGALAASVIVGVMLGWSLPRATDLPFTRGGNGLVARGDLAAALSQQLAADGATASGIAVALSFRGNDGRYCRSFSLRSGVDGLACRSEAGWQVEVIGQSAAASAPGDSYRQAASSLSPSVLDAISARQAGDMLAADEEAQARAAGWRASAPR
jgi:hypothetical protein